MTKEREYKKALIVLIAEVNSGIKRLDEEMILKESLERGGRIAQITNRLDVAIDTALHFTLGWSFEKIKRAKNKTRENYSAIKNA